MADRNPCRSLCHGLAKAKPFLAMVSLQFGYSGMYVIAMVSLKHGMSHYILALYRHVVATLVIAPFALVLERKIRPKLTLPIFLRIMVLGFLELERINVKKVHDVAKIVGTGITVAGAMVMTLYKGPIIDFIMSHGGSHHGSSTSEPTDQHWVIGTLMLLASCCGWASFFILQSFTLKQYPAELSLTALICLMGMVQGATVSLVMERDPTAWKIGFDSRLLAAAYSGVVCSGIAYYVQAIVIKQRGPVFATSFSPLCMIITAAMGTIILAEQLHLGSVIGAVLIVVGLYTVVWGKSKDRTISTTPALTDENKNGTLDFANADDAKSATNFDISIHNETSQIPAKSTPLPV
ncbi:WAT1-related protein At1g44800 isoform X2 [Hevea brasiliensis]|uniref:WAT1-related protein At1g44800 isoform X2 n=1 Tax=Hevea brasiliensis TaxID=3981 RepID=UPI000B77FAB8|nr:WAT1-related protein At1g44800 isoform X2 [Hevea brasiliensis]